MTSKNVEVKITPTPKTNNQKYPYWAVNDSGNLFLVTGDKLAICVEYWTEIKTTPTNVLTPLPTGTKIELTVL